MLSISRLFDQSWYAIKDQLGLTAGLSLVYFVAIASISMIPFLGGFLTSPLTAGYIICLLKIRDHKTIDYSDFFWGFLDLNRLIHLWLLGLLSGLLIALGFIFFIIPGIWFAVASSLSTTLLVPHKTDAVSAIKKSVAAVKGHWWKMFLLAITVGLLMLMGVICFFFGILITLPISVLMFVHAAEQLTNSTNNAPTPEVASNSFFQTKPQV